MNDLKLVMKQWPDGTEVKHRNTLLFRFLAGKYDDYKEPERKGTPKGEPVGLSKDKYLASLLMLYNFKIVDLSKLSGVSHGLLLKWRTERPFKGEKRKHINGFVECIDNFLSEFKKKHKSKIHQREETFNYDHVKKKKKLFDLEILNKFNDRKHYSESLYEAIYNHLSENLLKSLEKGEHYDCETYIWFKNKLSLPKDQPPGRMKNFADRIQALRHKTDAEFWKNISLKLANAILNPNLRPQYKTLADTITKLPNLQQKKKK